MLKTFLPYKLKLKLKLFLRYFNDLKSGELYRFSKKRTIRFNQQFTIKKTQELKKSSSLDAKIYNLKKAAVLVKGFPINSNEIFSFWNAIGNPSKKRGFKSGRTIIEGELSESVGGGLCQLSGLIYHLSLEAGLKIIERHNHSMDLYTNDTRYSPLGSDATVVYGYKDLRVANPFPFPLAFDFIITENQITAILYSKEKIEPQTVAFKEEKTENTNSKKVLTVVNNKVIATSYYKIPKPKT